MFFRRYIVGVTPLLVWAQDEHAADIVALVHAATMLTNGESARITRQWKSASE